MRRGGTILTKRKNLIELCYQLRNQCKYYILPCRGQFSYDRDASSNGYYTNEASRHGPQRIGAAWQIHTRLPPYCLSSSYRVPYSQRIYYKLAMYHEKVGEMTPNRFAEVFNARRNAILTSSNSDIPAANNSPG